MSSIRNTKNRIKSVQTTAKVTKAMKSIAAMRLRRYAVKTAQVQLYSDNLFSSVSSVVDSLPQATLPSILQGNSDGKILLVIIAPSRGFCGGLHRTAVSDCIKQLATQGIQVTDPNQVEMILVNKPAKRTISRNGGQVLASFDGPYKDVDTYTALPISELVFNLWSKNNYKAIYVSSAKSNSAFQAKVIVEQILPFQHLEVSNHTPVNVDSNTDSLILEMLPMVIQAKIHLGLLNTQTAEEGARMIAMNQATDNAKELEKALNIVYFRQRQAKITQEIAEIVGGSL